MSNFFKTLLIILLLSIFGLLLVIAISLYKLINIENAPRTAAPTTNMNKPSTANTSITEDYSDLMDEDLSDITDTKDTTDNSNKEIGTNSSLQNSITGKLCYPSETTPPMTVYLRNVATKKYIFMEKPQNSVSYTFENIPEGTYVAFAYTNFANGTTNNFGGSYSPAVACGLSVNCTDHKPVEIEIKATTKLSNVDICDWYSPADVPPKP